MNGFLEFTLFLWNWLVMNVYICSSKPNSLYWSLRATHHNKQLHTTKTALPIFSSPLYFLLPCFVWSLSSSCMYFCMCDRWCEKDSAWHCWKPSSWNSKLFGLDFDFFFENAFCLLGLFVIFDLLSFFLSLCLFSEVLCFWPFVLYFSFCFICLLFCPLM